MSTNEMFSFMDILILGCGGYLFYAWYLLKFRGEVKKGILIPSGNSSKCKDLPAYQKFMSPRLLIFALSAVFAGGLGLYSDYVKPLNNYVYLGFTGIFLVVLVWFTSEARKGERNYFS